MSVFEMKVPDVGEGVAEAELVEWLVAVGDAVTPDTVIAEVLTDKATVEVSAPVAGQVVTLHGEPGDVLAVGGPFIGIETEQAGSTPGDVPAATTSPGNTDPEPAEFVEPNEVDAPLDSGSDSSEPDPIPPAHRHDRTNTSTAAPAVRARADELGIDLATVTGSGPDGRVLHADLDRVLLADAGHTGASSRRLASDRGLPEPVRGVRRQIAQRMSAAWSDIAHITYVDDVDMTELERLRSELNRQSENGGLRLTILPFLARAMVVALADQPAINAHYDHRSETLTTFEAIHIGVATQTDAGLRVPVVRHAEGRGVRGLAGEISRVTTAARDGSATRDELTGSTITITSLGPLGGLVTTPIINAPELAIIGVNKLETRPMWRSGSFEPRQMMNLSSSFDHRMVDGWDAATFIQRIKRLLETPALMFVTDD